MPFLFFRAWSIKILAYFVDRVIERRFFALLLPAFNGCASAGVRLRGAQAAREAFARHTQGALLRGAC